MTDRDAVIGTRYAGPTAANALARDGVEVTSSPGRGVRRTRRLHRIAAGLRESATRDLCAALHPAVHARIDAADAICTVTVWNRPPGKADGLVAEGARFADSPAGALGRAWEAVFCGRDDDTVASVVERATVTQA